MLSVASSNQDDGRTDRAKPLNLSVPHIRVE
jgi:hypothetical protein